jgi:hypothetical protein
VCVHRRRRWQRVSQAVLRFAKTGFTKTGGEARTSLEPARVGMVTSAPENVSTREHQTQGRVLRYSFARL